MIRFQFAYDGPGLGKGMARVSILVTGKKAVEGKTDRT